MPQSAHPIASFAYVDEAGAKGLSHNLTSERDAQVGLMCALIVPAAELAELHAAFSPPFQKFAAAAGNGKLHITDAFLAGNEAWGAVAVEVREEMLDLIERHRLPVVYDARRLGLQRSTFEMNEAHRAKARSAHAARTSRVRLSQRPDDTRVETQLVEGLMMKLDAYAEDFGVDAVGLRFDEIDDPLAKHYRAVLGRLGTLSNATRQIKGWDTAETKPVIGTIQTTIESDIPIDLRHVISVEVVGKSDPLVLAVDIAANSLHRHLRALANEAPLNAPSSIAGWRLELGVYGVRDNALEDIL